MQRFPRFCITLGAETTFISKVGKDGLADFMFDDFKEAGMNIDYILESETEDTGQAFITVDAEGSNTIYVYGGANMAITPEDVDKAASKIKEADYIAAQLEVPVPAIIQAFKIAREAGVTTGIPDNISASNSFGTMTSIKLNNSSGNFSAGAGFKFKSCTC